MPLLPRWWVLLPLLCACLPPRRAPAPYPTSPAAAPAPRPYGPGPRPAPARGQQPRAQVQTRDGSRLKNAWIDTPDGLRVPAYGPWDSQLRVWCRLEHDGEGEQRCVPQVPSAYLRFLDHECQEPVLDTGGNKLLAPGSMVRVAVTDRCDQTTTRIFRVGARLPTALLWRGPGLQVPCQKSGPPEAGRT